MKLSSSQSGAISASQRWREHSVPGNELLNNGDYFFFPWTMNAIQPQIHTKKMNFLLRAPHAAEGYCSLTSPCVAGDGLT